MPNPANPSPLRLSSFTREDRLASTALLRDAIVVTCNGNILDFTQFSNISLTLHFEIPSQSLPTLTASLVAARIQLSSESEEALAAYPSPPDASVIQGSLQVTFLHSEPDLRRHIPAVPG